MYLSLSTSETDVPLYTIHTLFQYLSLFTSERDVPLHTIHTLCPTTHYSHTVSDPQPFWAEAAAPARGDFMLVLCLRLLSSTAQTVPPTHTWMPFVPFLCCSPVLHLIHLTKRKIYIYKNIKGRYIYTHTVFCVFSPSFLVLFVKNHASKSGKYDCEYFEYCHSVLISLCQQHYK